MDRIGTLDGVNGTAKRRGRAKGPGTASATARDRARRWITLGIGAGIPCLSLALSSIGGRLVADGQGVLGAGALVLCCSVLAVSLSHLAWAIRDITRSAWWQSWCLAAAVDLSLVLGELAGIAGYASWVVAAVMVSVTLCSAVLNCWAFLRHGGNGAALLARRGVPGGLAGLVEGRVMAARFEQYRPERLAEVVGQQAAVRQVQTVLARGWGGRAWWITGPSGSGKTTLARAIAALGADIEPGQDVLEPSAGTGNILAACFHLNGAGFTGTPAGGKTVAVEINAALADHLRQEYPLADVRCADFLACNGELGTFDRIVMNPPFANGADIRHIEHARGKLKPGGRLVAICANGPRQREKLQPLATEWIDLPAGSFAEQGTNVNAAIAVIDA